MRARSEVEVTRVMQNMVAVLEDQIIGKRSQCGGKKGEGGGSL